MYQGATVGVVVPAYNEERQIGLVLGTMPELVDRIYVVDDCSRDATAERCDEWRSKLGDRLVYRRHDRNRGVGAAIVTGYKLALQDELDVVAVMAGDGQMDPHELPAVLDPIVAGAAEYSKGNRLFTGEAWKRTPATRYLGNAFLSLTTKIASGYWHVADSQSGYTAISREGLEAIDLDAVYPSYGYPNDVLVRLNVANCRVADVPVRAVYGVGERSSMKIHRVIPTISWLLLRLFLWRLGAKYVIRDFHPLVFFFLFGWLLLTAGVALGALETYLKLTKGAIAIATIVLVALLTISGLQLLLFAMWFDMEYNRDLKPPTSRSARRRGGEPARLRAPSPSEGELPQLRAGPSDASSATPPENGHSIQNGSTKELPASRETRRRSREAED